MNRKKWNALEEPTKILLVAGESKSKGNKDKKKTRLRIEIETAIKNTVFSFLLPPEIPK